MATESRCPNPECKGTTFERVATDIKNVSDIQRSLVRCETCGTVVGVMDDTLSIVDLIAKKLLSRG